jgi:Zn-dependent metalloprotease/uncharacterized protein YjdB
VGKKLISIFLSLALISSIPVPVSAKEKEPVKDLGKVKTIEKLYNLSNGNLKLNEKDGQVVFLSGKLSGKQLPGKKSAAKFLEENKLLFGINNAAEDLESVDVKTDEIGHTHVKFVQVINGIKVEGSSINVHYDKDGNIVSVNGNLDEEKSVTTLGNETISESKAVEIAKKQYNYKDLRNVPKAEKVILNKDKKNYETYKVNISFWEPTIGNYDVYVEAHSGKVIKKENNIRYDGPVIGSGTDVKGITRSLNLYQVGSLYQMKDIKRLAANSIETYSLNHNNVDAYGNLPSGTLVSNNTKYFNSEDYKASVSAHFNAGKVIDFYKKLFNRNSLDNKGMAIKSYTHLGYNFNNAFWTGDEMVYGDGDGSTFTYLSGDLDVVGHEMTHGLIDYTADLSYHNQSGALNESMADVFGVLISTYDKYNVASGGAWKFSATDWVVGDDVYTPSKPGDALRSLSNPTLYNQPDRMGNYENLPDTESGDYGGVHVNSGIPNKAAYLVASKIGMEKTAKIYYRALVNYMSSNTDFEVARACLVQAATDLYGASSTAVSAITSSFTSVGIGQATVSDPYEPNDTFQSASPIRFGTKYQSYISRDYDFDYYKLNVSNAGSINIVLSDLPYNYVLELYNANGEMLKYSDNYGTTSEYINFYAYETGNYYIKVYRYQYSSFSTTQKYSLTATAPVSGVSLDKTSVRLEEGKDANLVATVDSADAPNKRLTWSSSNNSVATVDNTGKVKAVGEGTATITVTTVEEGYTASCIVTVYRVPVTGINLDRTTIELNKGQSVSLTASVSPANATNKNVNWSSSNISVATVDNAGKVRAVGEGTATITAATTDGGYTANCSVTVINAATGVILDKATEGLKVGETRNLTATVIPVDARDTRVTWRSSDASVAEVDNEGKITAKGLGKTTITVTTVDMGYTANCDIIVFEDPAVPGNVQAVSAGYNSIQISWSEVPGASRYEVYRLDSTSGNYRRVGDTAGVTYKDTGLATGTNYYYKVRAYKTVWTTNHFGDYSSVVSTKPVLSVPESTMAVSAGYNSIRISWNAVPGASSHEIWRSSSSGGTYAKIGEAAGSSYTNTGLTTATTYYYKVRAYRIVGTTKIYGGYSSIVSAKPIPSTPVAKAVSASYTSNKITWSAVSGATAYQVYRAASSTGAYSLINTTTSLSYTNTGLITGKSYYYKVRAYRTVGKTNIYSLYSTVVSATPVPAVPSSPKAVSASYSSIKTSWGAVKEANGYEVYRAASSTGIYSKVSTTTSLSYTNTGLKTGIAYYYKVRSYRMVGSTRIYGNFTAVVSARPIPEVPASPKAVSAAYDSIKISWAAAGGASGYDVYRSTSSTGTYTFVASTSSTSYINTKLTTNKTYYYKIKSYNTAGTSKLYGSFSSVVSTKPIPAVPTSVKAASNSYNSIKVSWIAVSGASGYEVYRSTSSTGTYSKVSTTSALSYTNTGLTTGKSYYYKVRAYRTVGTMKVYSSYCSVVSSKPVPAVPSSVKAVLSAYNSIKTSWGAVSGASGYQVYRATSSTGSYTLLSTTTSTSYTNKSLTTNKTYYYKIRAYKTVGSTKIYGSYSAVVSASTRTPYTPYYSTQSPSSTNSNASYVGFYLTNYGPTPLRVYSSNSYLSDDDSSYFDRSLQMVHPSSYYDISWIEFPSGSSGWVWFRVKGNPTWYDARSTIYFDFTYDSVSYRGTASNYYATNYWKK